MIDHVFSDGSRGHEYEVGDRVICNKEDYGLHGQPLGYVGKRGTVTSIHPYNKNSTYCTTFIHVKLDDGVYTKNLMSNFEPDCEPREEVQESIG